MNRKAVGIITKGAASRTDLYTTGIRSDSSRNPGSCQGRAHEVAQGQMAVEAAKKANQNNFVRSTLPKCWPIARLIRTWMRVPTGESNGLGKL